MDRDTAFDILCSALANGETRASSQIRCVQCCFILGGSHRGGDFPLEALGVPRCNGRASCTFDLRHAPDQLNLSIFSLQPHLLHSSAHPRAQF